MHSILAASLTGRGEIRASTIATAIGARTGAMIRWTTPNQAADEILRTEGDAAGASLIIVASPLPEQASRLGFDRNFTTLIQQANPAVLVVQGPVDWPPRRVLLPLDRSDLKDDTIADAARWTAVIAGEASSADEPPIELSVLHVAQDPNELFRDNARLIERRSSVREAYPNRLAVNTIHCTRWGAHPHKRIAAAVRNHRPTLLVLSRSPGAGGSPALMERSWFDTIGEAGCPVLLLPRVEEAVLPTGAEGSGADGLPSYHESSNLGSRPAALVPMPRKRAGM